MEQGKSTDTLCPNFFCIKRGMGRRSDHRGWVCQAEEEQNEEYHGHDLNPELYRHDHGHGHDQGGQGGSRGSQSRCRPFHLFWDGPLGQTLPV